MQPKEKQINFYSQLKSYAKWLFSELQRQGIELSVVENGLSVRGEMTPAEKENIRLSKRQLIEVLSPVCSHCDSPMNLIENGALWFCPLGCDNREVTQ